ncbi:MAG: hypothetical protein ABFS45_19800 [Pseudomonadota bacterium]
MRSLTLYGVLVSLGLMLVTFNANAVPSFARKYSTECSSCHTAYPQLNRAGRQFKEAGYRFPELKGEKTISDFLHIDKYFPVSAAIIGRPYDKKDSGEEKLRAIHEIELFVAGVMYKNVSGFFELEAEDEGTNDFGFDIGIPHAVLTYNHSLALNVDLAWGDILANDPYDTYTAARRLTRSTQRVWDISFGGADNGGALKDSRQTVAVHGRPIGQLYYSVGISGLADDSEGVNPRVFHGRLAYDVTPDIMIGALVINGECKSSSGSSACEEPPVGPGVDRDFMRYGFDTQIDIANFRVMGAYLTTEDRNTTDTSDLENDAWYLQGQYVFRSGGRPTWVPLVRFDIYETNDGQDDFSEVVLNLGYYFTENIKGYVEYWDQVDVPSNVDDDDRLTLQLQATF